MGAGGRPSVVSHTMAGRKWLRFLNNSTPLWEGRGSSECLGDESRATRAARGWPLVASHDLAITIRPGRVLQHSDSAELVLPRQQSSVPRPSIGSSCTARPSTAFGFTESNKHRRGSDSTAPPTLPPGSLGQSPGKKSNRHYSPRGRYPLALGRPARRLCLSTLQSRTARPRLLPSSRQYQMCLSRCQKSRGR